MMAVFELLLQDSLGQQVPPSRSFGCGNPISKQHCSDEGIFIELMMAVFELMLQDGLGQQFPTLGSLRCGNPIPEQHCSDVRVFIELMMDVFTDAPEWPESLGPILGIPGARRSHT
jgi:hypothetical protein